MKELKTLVADYQMSNQAREMLQKTPMVIMVSVTGGGKNRIISELLKTNRYHYVISHTTRRPRENDGTLEQNGINYWFIDDNEASSMLEHGEFVEAKLVHDEYMYGTSFAELRKAQQTGKVPLLEIDIQGVEEIMKTAELAIPIFIVPPDFDTWMKRLAHRGEMAPSEQQRRFETARKELKYALTHSYFHFVINDELDEAVMTVQEIIDGEAATEHGKAAAVDLLKHLD